MKASVGAQKLMQTPYVTFRKKGVELIYLEAMVNSKADKDYWQDALDLIASKKLDLQQLITKRITLKETINVFKYYDRRKWIKVIVEPQR
ncbi:MAG: hypothetical protein ACFFFH_02820 [Candidatus Thorarchaeota archaeon]